MCFPVISISRGNSNMKNTSDPALLAEVQGTNEVYYDIVTQAGFDSEVNKKEVQCEKVARTDQTLVSCFFCKIEFRTLSAYKCHICCASIVKTSDAVGETSYTCLICKIGFSHMSLLQKHLSAHRGYKCNFCHSSFMLKKAFYKHLTSAHCVYKCISKSIKKYICKYCDKSFRKRHLFHNHLKDHADGKVVLRTCDKTSSNTDVENSINPVNSSNSALFCKACNKHFEREHQFEQHLIGHETHKCTSCKLSFSTKKLWCKHQRQVHGLETEDKKHKCLTCNKMFQRPIHLVVHQRIHTGEKPLQCQVCCSSFSSKRALAMHKKSVSHFKKETGATVEKEKPFLCEECGSRFTHQHTLARHTKQVHKCNNFLQCPHCEYETKYEANLKRHVSLHDNVKPFMCEMCGASFHAHATLKDHQSYVHSENRNFECELCCKKFKGRSALQRHLRDHSDVRPFKCHCNQSYKRMSHLKRHMASAHQKTFTSKKLLGNDCDLHAQTNFEMHIQRETPDIPVSHIQSEGNVLSQGCQGFDTLNAISEKLNSDISTVKEESAIVSQYEQAIGLQVNGDIDDFDFTKSKDDSDYPLLTIPAPVGSSASDSIVTSTSDMNIPPTGYKPDIVSEGRTSPTIYDIIFCPMSEHHIQNLTPVTVPQTVLDGTTNYTHCKISPTANSVLISPVKHDPSVLNSFITNNFSLPGSEILCNPNKNTNTKSLFDECINTSLPLFSCTLESLLNGSSHQPSTEPWVSSTEEQVNTVEIPSSEISASNTYSLSNALDVCSSFLFPSDSHLSLDDAIPQADLDFYTSIPQEGVQNKTSYM